MLEITTDQIKYLRELIKDHRTANFVHFPLRNYIEFNTLKRSYCIKIIDYKEVCLYDSYSRLLKYFEPIDTMELMLIIRQLLIDNKDINI